MTDTVQTIRIPIRVQAYETKHYGAITDIIGTNIIIKSITKLPMIVNNQYIFDVTYVCLSLNPLKFFVIETKDIQLISEFSTNYYTKIGHVPVKVKANMQLADLQKHKKVMLQVVKTLCSEQVNREFFKYSGTVITNPLHSYISILGETYGYNLNTELKKWQENTPIKIFSKDEIEMEYNLMLSNSMYGKQFTVIEEVENESDVKNKMVGYKIDAHKITNFPFNGIVFVSKKRANSHEVIVGINNNFSFAYEQWLTLMNFLETELDNYNQFLETL